MWSWHDLLPILKKKKKTPLYLENSSFSPVKLHTYPVTSGERSKIFSLNEKSDFGEYAPVFVFAMPKLCLEESSLNTLDGSVVGSAAFPCKARDMMLAPNAFILLFNIKNGLTEQLFQCL